MIRIDSASVWLSGGKENPQMLGTRISSSTTTWVGISGSIDMKPSEHVFLLHRSLAHCDERHDMFRDSTIDFYLRIRKQFFVKVLPSQIRSFATIQGDGHYCTSSAPSKGGTTGMAGLYEDVMQKKLEKTWTWRKVPTDG